MGDSDSGFFFPEEFPYDCSDYSNLSSPVGSSDSNEDDKDDPKNDLGCSPQSTLCSDRDWEESHKPTVAHRQLQVDQFQQLKQQQILREQKMRRRPPVESGMRDVLFSGSTPRRESTGTGVFLPRGTISPTDTRKKPACSTVLLPARVVQALNLNVHEIGARPIFPGGFILDKDTMKARTRTLQSQQRTSRDRIQSSQTNQREIRLPLGWTY